MLRRHFLAAMGALGASVAFGPALAGSATDPRLVVVVLRGGLDGLAAVPAPGDPHFGRARGALAEVDGVVDLDGTFGLHPALGPLRPLYDAGELLVVHAIAAPYRLRSHFDAQNVLETGAERPHATRTGWLSRALPTGSAMAVGRDMPLLLRGPASATSLDPLRRPRPDAPLHRAVAALYEGDPALSEALAQGMAAQRLLARHAEPSKRGDAEASARIVARILADPEGPRTAVFSMGGWDTHTGQANRLNRRLGELSSVLTAFATATPAAAWARTAIVVVTEFGRTVAPNGTGGTDHGVGGAALLAGGAVAGGRVVADWPGLKERDRLEGRDLRPTTDVRAMLKGVLHDHLGVARARLDDEVFPASADVAPLPGLLRG